MASSSPRAKALTLEEIVVGATVNRVFRLTLSDVTTFSELSGDHSPIHVDAEEAARRGFNGVVAHGLLLGGYVSALLGMELPGARGLLQSFELQFRRPVCPPCSVRVVLEVTGVSSGVRQVRLSIKITDEQDNVCATGKASSIVQ